MSSLVFRDGRTGQVKTRSVAVHKESHWEFSGFGVTLGTQRQSVDTTGARTFAAPSTVGSTEGSVGVFAGNAFGQIGSHVLDPAGDVDIAARSVVIREAQETARDTQETRFSQSGLSIGVTSPVLSAIDTARQMRDASRQTGDSRLQVLAGATSALAAKNALDAAAAARATGEHRVLTKRGLVAVQELRAGDSIATGYTISEAALDVVCASLLGNGSIDAKGSQLRITHTFRESEYLRLKADLLTELRPSLESRAPGPADGGEVPPQEPRRLGTLPHRALGILRTHFGGDRKAVPAWIETRLSDRMLAFWFMDEGYLVLTEGSQPLAEMATSGLATADMQRLAAGLARLGIYPQQVRGRLHFGAEQTRKLSEIIAPFVPPYRRYKLHPDVAARVPYDPTRLKHGRAEVLYDEVEAVQITNWGTDRTFFCLEVEDTHNVVTFGGVVADCVPRPCNNAGVLRLAENAPISRGGSTP